MLIFATVVSCLALLGVIVDMFLGYSHMKYHQMDMQHSVRMDRRLRKAQLALHTLAFQVEEVLETNPELRKAWHESMDKVVELFRNDITLCTMYGKDVVDEFCDNLSLNSEDD
jgi:uncharacterized membrane-anchored protein YhcB (DUF1043 family)